MKKLINCFIALAALFVGTACEHSLTPDSKVGSVVSLKVSVPQEAQTRAIADGTNVDVLYYEVYDSQMSKRLAYGKVGKTADKVFDLDLTLVQDQTYNFLFWAQVDGANYYNVNNLREVTANYNKAEGNDEQRAAFFASEKFFVGKETLNKDVYLKRPFAQLNFGTRTFKSSMAEDVVINGSVISLSTVSTKFDVATGVGSSRKEDLQDVVFTADGCPKYPSTLTVNGKDYEYLSMNYFFVPGEESTVTVGAEFYTSVGLVTHKIFSVRVAENYRTNIVGDLLFNKADFNIYVDNDFVKKDDGSYDDKNYDSEGNPIR